MFRFIVISALVLSFAAGGYLAKGNVSGELAYEQKDYATAFKKLKDDHSPRAQFYLGTMYADGLGVDKNKVEAIRWFQQAAEQGFAEAQFTLGVISFKGDGVPQDKAAAVKWYRLAADQGNTRAQFNLGILYGTGDGVQQDQAEALRLIRMAADLGNQTAKKALLNLTKPGSHQK